MIFIAKFSGECDACEFPIREGQKAKFNSSDSVEHVECPSARPVCTDCWVVHGTHQEECE